MTLNKDLEKKIAQENGHPVTKPVTNKNKKQKIILNNFKDVFV